MKIELHTQDLKLALAELALFVPKRTAIKELQHVRMATEGSRLVLFATDLSSSLQVTISGIANYQSGTVLVEFITLQNVIKNCETTLVSLELVDGKLAIDGFSLATIDTDSYPDAFAEANQRVSASISSKYLHDIMSRVAHAAASGTFGVQGYLGVRLTVKDFKLTCATQDGWRLAEASEQAGMTCPFRTLIDMQYVNALRKILPAGKLNDLVTISTDGCRLKFTWGNHVVIIKTGEGDFMDYEGFFPNDFSEYLDVDRKDLIAKIKKAGVIAKEIGYRIQLHANYPGGLKISTKTDKADMEAHVKTVLNVMPDGRSVALNGQYLLDTLSSIESEMVTLAWAGEETPVYVCPSGMYTHDRDVIMSLSLRRD